MTLAQTLAEMHQEPEALLYWERIATELGGHRKIARGFLGAGFRSALDDYSALVRQCAKANHVNLYQAAKDVAKSACNVMQRSLIMASVAEALDQSDVAEEQK